MSSNFYTQADVTRLSGASGSNGAGEPGRSAFRKDYARLLHAPSFRRLQGKTQLFPSVESDFFRNRLTHSLEVAQIASGIATALNETEMRKAFPGCIIDCDLVEFAALAHDLGHPPFGHNGEKALDELMAEHGGFEGNAQTLRIVSVTERKLVRTVSNDSSTKYGLDLTYRALASVLKYDSMIPIHRSPGSTLEKGYYASEAKLVRKIKRKVAPGFEGEKFKTIECAIMDVADDIAYSTYDLEDSLHAGFLTPYDLLHALSTNKSIAETVLRRTNDTLQSNGYKPLKGPEGLVKVLTDTFGVLKGPIAQRKVPVATVLQNMEAWNANRVMTTNNLVRTQFTAERIGKLIHAVELVPNEHYPQLSGVRLVRDELLKVEVLKHLNFELVIRSPQLAVVEHRGKDLVKELFCALLDSGGTLLPREWREVFGRAETKDDKARTICDYVAGMTDHAAAELHSRLFGKGTTIFKPLY